MQGANATANAIGNVSSTIGGAMTTFGKLRENEQKMDATLDYIGALNDPVFAEKYAKSGYGAKQGLFASAFLDYQRNLELVDEGRKMEQEKAMIQWRANFAENFSQLPDQDRNAVVGLATDYVEGTNAGLVPDQNFVKKVFSLPTKAQHLFFSLLSKGMEVFGRAPQKQVQDPRFVQGPNGGQVMLNPNTGAAQYIKPEAQDQMPTYGTMPAPAPGTVGVLKDGKGNLRVIPNTGMPVQGNGGALGGQLFNSSPDEAQQHLNDPKSLDALFGE